MKDETREIIVVCIIILIMVISFIGVLQEIQERTPPYPCNLTISNKYIETKDFYFFETNSYYFEFEENPYFNKIYLDMIHEQDYYEYEIGDNYSYYWVEEW